MTDSPTLPDDDSDDGHDSLAPADAPPAEAVPEPAPVDMPGAAPAVVFAETPEPLHPKIRIAWLIEELIGAVVLGGIAWCVDFLWLSPHVDWWPFARGVLFTVVLVGQLVWAAISPKLTYRHWRYAVRAHDVLTMSGIFWRTQRSVPRLRIQHVELETGPITRRLGLVSVTFYTAGTGAADAKIPGLRPEVAEAIRDRLLEHDLPSLAAREAVGHESDAGNEDADDVNSDKPAPSAASRTARKLRDVEGQLMLFTPSDAS